MKRHTWILVLILVGVLGTNLHAFTLNWTHDGKYPDGTNVETTDLPVMFDAWQDGMQIANGVTIFSAPLVDNTFGASHIYKIRARLKDGRVSDNAVATLSNPADDRKPAACSVSGMSIGK